MQPDLKKMSEVEIKAAIYDRLATIENAQNQIKIFSQELVSRKGILQKVAKEIVRPPKK